MTVILTLFLGIPLFIITLFTAKFNIKLAFIRLFMCTGAGLVIDLVLGTTAILFSQGIML